MELSKWDPAESIRSEKEARTYLEEAAKEGNASELADTIGWVARAYGMRQLAEQAGLTVDDLFKALGRFPSPEMSDLIPILEALGVSVSKHSDAAE